MWRKGFTRANALFVPSLYTTHPIISCISFNTTRMLSSAAGPTALRPPVPTPREVRLEALSNEVFAKGNVHLKNVETLSSLPEGLFSFPEVCFIGKPNVGKSTLISCLLHNPRLGRASTVPGTTRLLQFFNVGDALLLVDTPGYGGWMGRRLDQKAADRANAFAILFRYLALRKSHNLRRVYWLMEASVHGPVALQERDEDIRCFLAREQIPFSIVLTKIDRHYHHYAKQCAAREAPSPIGSEKDGTPIDGTTVRQQLRRPLVTPQEGIERNIAEIADFLGTDRVPILGVSANNRYPERCMNLTALQHDLVSYCAAQLRDDELQLSALQQLSYAPPTPEAIEATQLRYPLESFIVPENNNVSLAHMVQKHEEAKAALLSRELARGRLTAKERTALHLVDLRQLHTSEAAVAQRRQEVEALPKRVVLLQEKAAPLSALNLPTTDRSAPTTLSTFQRRATLRDTSAENEEDRMAAALTTTTTLTAAEEAQEGEPAPHAVVPANSTRWEPLPSPVAPSLPAALDPHAHYVTAINGVRIPRSLWSSSVAQLAMEKEDELAAFALRSGAGAYEELLQQDEDPTAPLLFTEHDRYASLPEEEAEQLVAQGQLRRTSAARRQQDRLLAKYVDQTRKERAVYMQAEGYMCPWVATPGQPGRRAVVGAAEGSSGTSGGVMRGLKQHGFGGGKSYSARTMRHKGRATRKSGRWAT